MTLATDLEMHDDTFTDDFENFDDEIMMQPLQNNRKVHIKNTNERVKS